MLPGPACPGTIAERGQEEVYKRAGLLSQADEAFASAADCSGSGQVRRHGPWAAAAAVEIGGGKGIGSLLGGAGGAAWEVLAAAWQLPHSRGAARHRTHAHPSPALPLPCAAQVTCLVCMSDVAPGEATTMECGHTFCNDCWREHMR